MHGACTRAQFSRFRPCFFEVVFQPPKLPQNAPQNQSPILNFCILFGSWAAPRAFQIDFGRSQSAPGALRKLFEIIKAFENPHFDAVGRSWGPLGALIDPQEHPKSPKCSQNASQIVPKCIQNTSKMLPKSSHNCPKIIRKTCCKHVPKDAEWKLSIE